MKKWIRALALMLSLTMLLSVTALALGENETVFDPMAGSGTSGASAIKNGYKAILCDMNEEYIQIMEKRLNVKRIKI